MSQFAGVIEVTEASTLADAIAAAGGPRMGHLRCLKIRTANAIHLHATNDGATQPDTGENDGYALANEDFDMDGASLDANTTWLTGTGTAISVFAVE
jgi:hypothetical protein